MVNGIRYCYEDETAPLAGNIAVLEYCRKFYKPSTLKYMSHIEYNYFVKSFIFMKNLNEVKCYVATISFFVDAVLNTVL